MFSTPFSLALNAANESARDIRRDDVLGVFRREERLIPQPVPRSSARRIRRRTASFASVTDGDWMPGTKLGVSASAVPSDAR